MKAKQFKLVVFGVSLSTLCLIGAIDEGWIKNDLPLSDEVWKDAFTPKEMSVFKVDDNVYLQTKKGERLRGAVAQVGPKSLNVVYQHDKTTIEKGEVVQLKKGPRRESQAKPTLKIEPRKVGLWPEKKIEVGETRYKDLIMIVDTTESELQAMGGIFFQAVYDRAAPILVSKNTFYKYLEVKHDMRNSIKAFMKKRFPQFTEIRQEQLAQQLIEMRYEPFQYHIFSGQRKFDLDQWDIYSQGFYCLLIPHAYKEKKKQELSPQRIDDINELAKYYKKAFDEILLGFNLSSMEDIKAKIKIVDDLLNMLSSRGVKASTSFKQDIEPLFMQNLKPITISVVTTNRQPERGDESRWLIYLAGHGLPPSLRSGSRYTSMLYGGFKDDDFLNFLEFFNSKSKAAFLYVGSCFAGGRALTEFQRDVDVSVKKDVGRMLLYGNPGFMMIVGSIADRVAEGEIEFGPGPDYKLVRDLSDFNDIFSFLNGYFLRGLVSTGESDPFKGLLRLVAAKSSISFPHIWIPSIGFLSALQLDEKVTPITHVFSELTFRKNKPMTIESASLLPSDYVYGLLLANRVRAHVVLGSMATLVPASRKGYVYLFDDVTFAQGLSVFITNFNHEAELVIYGQNMVRYPYNILLIKNAIWREGQATRPVILKIYGNIIEEIKFSTIRDIEALERQFKARHGSISVYEESLFDEFKDYLSQQELYAEIVAKNPDGPRVFGLVYALKDLDMRIHDSTFLIEAIKTGNPGLVKILLDAGANPSFMDGKGNLPEVFIAGVANQRNREAIRQYLDEAKQKKEAAWEKERARRQ